MKGIEEIAKELGAEILKLGRPVRTVREAMEATGAPAKMIIKSLLLITEKGPVLAIIDGESKLDFSKVEERYGKARMASRKEVEEISGFPVGGVPPVGVRVETLVDPKVLENEFVYGGGGSPDSLIKIDPRKIVEYQRAKVIQISKGRKLLFMSYIWTKGDRIDQVGRGIPQNERKGSSEDLLSDLRRTPRMHRGMPTRGKDMGNGRSRNKGEGEAQAFSKKA